MVLLVVLRVLVVELAQVPEEKPEEMTTRHGSSPVIYRVTIFRKWEGSIQ